MQLVIFALLIYFGAADRVLRWQPFAWIVACTLIATWVQSAINSNQVNVFGEREVGLFEPRVFALNWAFGVILWSTLYLIGHGFGRMVRWWRARKR